MDSDFINDFINDLGHHRPIAALPVFIGLTTAFDAATRGRVAAVTTAVAFVRPSLLHLPRPDHFDGAGRLLHSFEIAGGLILFAFAMEMVLSRSRKEGDARSPARVPFSSPYTRSPYPIWRDRRMLTVILRTDNTRFSIIEQAHTTAASLWCWPSPSACCCSPAPSPASSAPAAPM